MYLRVADYLRQSGLDKHYIHALEDYAQTQATPKVYDVLYARHMEQTAVLKAQHWLETGVAESDPKSVVTHVRFDTMHRISLCRRACIHLCREMLRSEEPNLALATSMLRAARENGSAFYLWRQLTEDSIYVLRHEAFPVALSRLKQINPQYPLRTVMFADNTSATPQLLSAISNSTSVEMLDFYTRCTKPLTVQVNSVSSLRKADLRHFPADEGLELLQSRSNWTRIHLSSATAGTAARAFAARNRSDFSLCGEFEEAQYLSPWLANPHLTALSVENDEVTSKLLDGLQHCHNLTSLVSPSFASSTALRRCVWIEHRCLHCST
jgi:hypothetical protein